MDRYQIFLASSINEFRDIRNNIGDFIRRIQDELIDANIKLKLFECEFFDNSMAIGRKQDEYCEEIKKSQIFIMLIGKSLGKYTLEEYNTALMVDNLAMYVLQYDTTPDESIISFINNMDKKVSLFTFENEKKLNYHIANILQQTLKNVSFSLDEEKLTINNKNINL